MLLGKLIAVSEEVGNNFMKSLEIMWKGVVAIFVVIALVILCTEVLKRSIKVAAAKKELKEQEAAAAGADAENKN